MAESSVFWSTSGTGDGSASGYTATQIFELYRALFAAANANLSGVAPDYLNKLAVSGASSPVAVNTGAAVVYGIPYFNSAAVNVTIPTPTTNNRIDRIVLRASWSSQTVRITRIAGTEGAGTPPALTQSPGVTWDMPLATVSVTTGGVITVTDDREYLLSLGPNGVSTSKIANAAVTTAKIADGAVTSAKIADGAIATLDIADSAISALKIASNAVTTAKLADSNVTTAKLADSNVTTAKLADDNVTNAKLANMGQATVKGRASGAGTGDPADLTAAQVVAIVATADGTGSGLDADLLDGQHATAFAAVGHTHGTADIADDNVTNAKLANMGQATVKGRASGAGTGDPADLTAAQVVAIVATADGTGSGLDADLLDGQHAAAFAAVGHTHGTADIADDAITNAKLANMNQYTVKGRVAAGAGDPSDLTAANLVTLIGMADGSGSGLDADLLDGQHAAAFAAAGHTHGASGIADGAITTAKLANVAVTNAKIAAGAVGWSQLADSCVFNNNIADGQISNAKLTDVPPDTIKGRILSGTGDAQDIPIADFVTTLCAFDGPGSGLDADLLDGQHAAAFAASNHAHTTPWTNITLNGANMNPTASTPQYRLNGDVVELRGSVSPKSNGYLAVCTLPNPPVTGNHFFRPGNVGSSGGDGNIYFVIGNDGILYMANALSGWNLSLDMIRYSTTA